MISRYQCPNCKRTYRSEGYASVVFLNDISHLVCNSVLPCCDGQYFVASVFDTKEEAESTNYRAIALIQSAQADKFLAPKDVTEIVRLVQKDIGIHQPPDNSPRDHHLNS